MNVLIVDDVSLIRQNIISLLKGEASIACFEAGTVIDAKRVLDNKSIDVLFLDLNLTKYKDRKDDDKNGLEVVRYIRSNNFHSPHIVVISGTVNERDVKAAFQLGIKDFITKPYRKEDVIKIVNNLRLQERGLVCAQE